MIKTGLVQLHNVGTSTTMVGVACATIQAALSSVKTHFVFDVGPYFLVAVGAQFGLPERVQSDMAIAAICFKLCMRFNHLAWHQDAFKCLSLCKVTE